MLLTSIKLTGWRSFGPEGVELNDLRPSNLLLGPNNVGKSNVVRFLTWLRGAIIESKLPQWDNTEWQRFVQFEVKCTEADFWLRDATARVVAELTFAWEHPDIGALQVGQLFDRSCKLRAVLAQTLGAARLFVTPILNDGSEAYAPGPKGGVLKVQNQDLTPVAMICLKALAANLIDIEALRHPGLEKPASGSQSTHGGGFTPRLHEAAIDPTNRRKWTLNRQRLEQWIERLSGESEIQLEANPNETALVVPRGNEFLSCSLSDLGTGVAEALVILEFLLFTGSKHKLVCIEEPEAHLHAGAVNELVRILENDLERPQLLITSHSTSLVDQARDHWRIFRFTHGADGSTSAAGTETEQEQFELLDDLGIRASQLFLADVTIWVEGPSDMAYLAELLRRHAPHLVPGRHYAFVPYGGSSASHLTFDKEDSTKLAKLLHVSRHVIVIGDRDSSDPDTLPANLQRLYTQAGGSSGGSVYPTLGREIENLVNPDVLREAVETLGPRWVQVSGQRRRLRYHPGAIRAGDSFDTSVAAAAKFADGDLSEEQQKHLARQISKRKVAIANRVVAAAEPFKADAQEWIKGLVEVLSRATRRRPEA